MKETIQDLIERRSCRKYLPEQIPNEVLNTVLKAGTYAPNGLGKQSSVIVVVQDPETLKTISALNGKAAKNPMPNPFYGAPTLLIVFADRTVPTYQYDGALVMGNLLNAAHAVGLGSCYIFRAKQVFETPEGKELMKKWGLSDDYEGVGNCILGYAAEDGVKPASPRKENYIIWD